MRYKFGLIGMMFCATLLVLFASCSKDSGGSESGSGNGGSTSADLVGTSWSYERVANENAENNKIVNYTMTFINQVTIRVDGVENGIWEGQQLDNYTWTRDWSYTYNSSTKSGVVILGEEERYPFYIEGDKLFLTQQHDEWQISWEFHRNK